MNLWKPYSLHENFYRSNKKCKKKNVPIKNDISISNFNLQ